MSLQDLYAVGQVTTEDFAAWGLGEAAYVREAQDTEGNPVWAIFRADGEPLGAAESRDVAFAAIRQYELEPLSTH